MSKYKIIDGEEVEVEETKPFLAGALLETAKTPVTPYRASHALLETAKTPVTPYRASHVLLNTADAFVENKDKRKILEAGMGPRREIPEESNDKENTATFANGYTSLIPGFDGIGEEKYNEIFNQPEIKVKKPTARERYETRQFEYNLEDDPLWQQYISSARRNGQNAMTDTMAKVASQTGGIAGSYAVAAGAGAYNDYMQEANEVIPYLEQLAYQKYQDELNRDLNLYEMEEKEKKEKANEDALVYEWTEKGDITENEEIFLRNQGYWFDENGMLVGPDGNRYATKGGVITDIEADYRAGDTLSPEDILKIENSGQGYKYQNGYLYKNGVLIPRDYMPYNEIQIALDDFASNTWYGMSPENQQILRSHGFVLDASSGNITDGKEYYAPNNGTATDNLLWKYIAGYQFTPDEMLFMNNQPGYSWSEDGKLLLDGEEIKKMTEADKSKKLANGEIPSDLAAAWSEIVDKRGTNKSLSASVYKVLGDYGFIRSNGQWIHQETGQTLDSFFGDAPSVTNPGGGTQGGTTSGTSTGGRTRYTKTPPQQESVVETPLKTPPAGGVFPPPAPKTAQDAYNDAVGMMARGDTAIAKSIIENAVNSGTMTEAQGKAFFKEYVDRYTK